MADDDRRAWTPVLVVAVLIAALAVGVVIAFRADIGRDDVTGTIPASLPDLTTVPPTAPTTPAPTTAPTTTPVVVAPTIGNGGGGGSATTIARGGDPETALTALAAQSGARATSEIVSIGADQYAMLIVLGRGQLVRWTGREWEQVKTVAPLGTINTVRTADVTGDGIAEFILGLGGLAQPGGVYGQANLVFDFLPFNTATGLEDLVDGLQLRLGRLESPLRDASGTRTQIWTWTGRMFETR